MDTSSLSPCVTIDYFSDVLCVWAYVSQARLDELDTAFGENVQVNQHFITLFGNTENRIGTGWKNKDGFAGFNRHVIDICEQFEQVSVHSDVWLGCRPKTSGTAHLFLKAVQVWLLDQKLDLSILDKLIWDVRCQFFVEAKDIGCLTILLPLLDQYDLPRADIEVLCINGEAMAGLCNDMALRDNHKLEGSPTYLLNNGRQKLYGNVGYRIIEANVQELLQRPEGMASWC